MICPGVKRRPPIGSELDRGSLLEGVRGVRGVEGVNGVFLRTGEDGPIVAPSKLASSPNRVAPASGSTASPHEEQNFPFRKTCAPHFEQNIGSGIFPLVGAPPRTHPLTTRQSAQ